MFSSNTENNILIVDDVVKNIQILGKILNEKGYNVEFATNGQEAIESANSNTFDLILLDIMMPGMNGFEVCEILKSNNKTSEIPVIFMTALSETEHKVKAFEIGAVDYITKPFQSNEVLARIHTHLMVSHLQKEMRNTNKFLEQKVDERTKQFHEAYNELQKRNHEILKINNDLIAAKEKAEESDRLKSAFLQNMSHEVRTPLNAISGFSKLMAKPNQKPEKVTFFSNLVTLNCDKLIGIITDVIEISQIQSKQVYAIPGEFDFITFIWSIVENSNKIAKEKSIDLNLEIKPDLKVFNITSDKEKLNRIVSHLIDNALKFTVEGSVTVKCNLQENIVVSVKDTGIGISEEMQQIIFEPFRQVETGICRNFGGNGLGLPIAKTYATLLGGSITLKSEYNAGSTFTLTIPADSKSSLIENARLKNKTPVKTILIAEDENSNYEFLAELIEQYGFYTLRTRNGQETLDMVRTNNDIELILMDIKMPIMDGHTAAKLIKQFRSDLPIIAQSAYALDTEKEKYGDIFDDYITKPIEEQKLKQKLSKYTNNQLFI